MPDPIVLWYAIPTLLAVAVSGGTLIAQGRARKDREIKQALALQAIDNKLTANATTMERVEKTVNKEMAEVKEDIKTLKNGLLETQGQARSLCQFHQLNHPGQVVQL